MLPTGKTLGWVIAWAIAGVVASVWPAAVTAWWIAGAVMFAVLLADALRVRFLLPVPEIERRLPGRFAVGEPGEVRLTLRQPGRRPQWIELFDGIPAGADAPAMPWSGELPPHREVRVFHPVKLSVRGEVAFGPVHLRQHSPWGFWLRRTRSGTEETVKVYPNYEPVVRYALLAMQHRESPMGIARRALAGSSREFRQLRDYREGDSLAQVDWKATSRRQSLISREWQEQRNQSVVFLVDTSRRMRAMDGELPQFDHGLNAMLLVAHVALRQGDQVGVQSFGGTNRWLPPVKGVHAMPVLLNHLYDYQTTPHPGDFTEAVEKLMARQRRRALVIVLTNLRGEDGRELIPALQVLREKHLVLLASLSERTALEARTRPVREFADALKFAAADRYFAERREVLAELSARGVLTLDTTAQELAVGLANRYLDIKAAGRL